MALPPAVIASIISAVIDMTGALPDRIPQYQEYVRLQQLPPEAKYGLMQPPRGDGTVFIDNNRLRLSPALQIRNLQNLIIVPSHITQPTNVVYLNDLYGFVHRVWMITSAEAESLRPLEPIQP
jgi:hypothetical protein